MPQNATPRTAKQRGLLHSIGRNRPPSEAAARRRAAATEKDFPTQARTAELGLNPAMKILTQRRQGAKVRRFATVLTAVIIHPAGDRYLTGLLFVSPIPLRL